MNVKELKELLNNFPDEMEVVVTECGDDCCHDYKKIEVVKIVNGLPKANWILEDYDLTPEVEKLLQLYLYIGY